LIGQGKLPAESIRVLVEGNARVQAEMPEGMAVSLSYVGSVTVELDQDVRFFRGLELTVTAPQAYLDYYGSLAVVWYADLAAVPGPGAADIEARQIGFELLPNKIQSVYQIPIKTAQGIRASPYIGVPTEIIPPESFPILFRIMPIVKGLTEEIESLVFQIHIKPLMSGEGAVKIIPRYPEQLPGKPFVALIDDVVLENINEEQILREGSHHLVILSEDYRNENRRFLVERGKILHITVELQDPTPLIFFEAPENTQIFMDNEPLIPSGKGHPVDPGRHEVKFQMSDYAILRILTVQKGKRYRVALTIDIGITESE
jgi:hypothetical protein